MLLHRQKIITKNNKGLSLPIQALSDYSSLPESENIFSNSSFVSKKILDVIFYLIKCKKNFFFYSANRKYEKRIYRDRSLLDKKLMVGSVGEKLPFPKMFTELRQHNCFKSYGPTTPTTTERHDMMAVTPNVSSYIAVI